MKKTNRLRNIVLYLSFLTIHQAAFAQKITPITKNAVEVGKQIQLFDGNLYYSTAEDKGYKLWACDVLTKKSRLVMKSKTNIAHFFVRDKTLLFTVNNGHAGEDGTLYYLDKHHKPVEVLMKEEAGPDVEPAHGRHIEIFAFHHGFLILAPVRDMIAKNKLYRYNEGKDSARRFLPEEYYVYPGLVVSPDQKLIIAGVEVTPPHPWENHKEFWNKYSQLILIHNDESGALYEKWMDHAELIDAGFRYTKRTWINLTYKELKDKGEDVVHHTVYVVTNPSEKKGTMPKHVGEAVDTSLFLFQKKVCYYFSYKGNIYLVAAFEYPTSYQLKYGKLKGHDMDDFSAVYRQFAFDEVLYIITKHNAKKEYYCAWKIKYNFDTAEWLMAHTFMTAVNYDEGLSATMPTAAPLRIFTDTTGRPVYMFASPEGDNNKLYVLGKNGAVPIALNSRELSKVQTITAYWRGNFILRQKGGDDASDRLLLFCKTGTGLICSPGDKYLPDFDFECNGQWLFGVFTYQTKKRINWISSGTLEGTSRLNLEDLSLQLDFSMVYIAENSVFLMGKYAEPEDSKEQLFVLDL